MALSDYFDGRTVIRVICRHNGNVENATDYLPQSDKDMSTPGKWEMLLSFVENNPTLFDVEFTDDAPTEGSDKKGNYSKAQLEKMGIPKLNALLNEYSLSGMPSKASAIQAILDAQGSKG